MKHITATCTRLITTAVLFLFTEHAFSQETITLPVFGSVRVIDSVSATENGHRFIESPAGASKVETILGAQCRVMPVQQSDSSFIAYRLGEGKGLKANGSYVVVIEYPDDLPRNYIIHNRAVNSKRSFCTGTSIGDAWGAKYVDNHTESLNIPQSGKFQQWTCYVSLQDRTQDIREQAVDAKDNNGNTVKDNKGNPKKMAPHTPADGFDFGIAQYGREHDPNTTGIAFKRILLCEIPNEKECYAKLVMPPAGLPRRNLFWREEMADGCIQGDFPDCTNRLDWFEQKARQMKMLGMNTYMKDLMEFGHVQHWDPHYIRTNWAWSGSDQEKVLWEGIINIMSKYGFSIMPYYEWVGNKGAEYNGQKAFGDQKRAETLSGEKNYTHIWWTEAANIDVTDPESVTATQQLFDGTILRFKDKAKFVGAFFRTRPTEWPVSFSDATRSRFAQEANNGTAVSRQDLRQNRQLYNKYLEWWHVKRADFLNQLQKYLAEKGLPNTAVILDSETSEPGPGISGGGMLVDDKEYWNEIFAGLGWKPAKMLTTKETVDQNLFLKGRREPAGTWGKWEWQHACPGDDPENYQKLNRNVWLAMPINRLYSVADPKAFDAYSNPSGVETIVRHYSLNENMVYRKIIGKDGKPGEERLVGYAIHDTERAGRACMQNEVMAMAKGNPVNIGYLVGSNFTRGFPEPVREFNQNFLALPALKSKIVEGACDDPEVTLREIDAGGYGKYFALVHTGNTPKKNLKIRFPEGTGRVSVVMNGKTVPIKGGVLTTGMNSWQLIALHETK